MRINKILYQDSISFSHGSRIAVSSTTTGKHKILWPAVAAIPSISYCSTGTTVVQRITIRFWLFSPISIVVVVFLVVELQLLEVPTVISYQKWLSRVSNRFSLTKVFLAHCIFLPYQYLLHSILNNKEEEEEQQQQR